MLYSTKRKLHNLLNGPAAPSSSLSTASTSPHPHPHPPTQSASSPSTLAGDSPPPSSAAAETPTKRSRLAAMPRPSIRAVSPSGSLRSTVSAGSVLRSPSSRGGPPGQQQQQQQSGAYAPWDRGAFLSRLATFRFVDKWTAKPAAVNEVAWAKRGWVCSDKNRVRCTVCRKEVVVRVDSEDDTSEEGRAVVETFAGMIVGEHDESCLWVQKGCDDTIYRLPLASSSQARAAFTERYLSLIKIHAEIPSALFHPELDLSALDLPAECTAPGPIISGAAILALFGWQNDEPGIPSLVTCSACFRRLGLWLFRSKDASGEASVCRLDVVGEHRDYCPWVNAGSQGKEPGWRTLHRVLRRSRGAGSSAASVRSFATDGESERERTPAERDADEDSKLKKLKRLKTLYFGKKKSARSLKEKDKDKDGSRPPTATQ